MPYLLDANVFIEANRRYYGMDFCPAFWAWLDEANGAGRVYSVEKVGFELRAGSDQLAAWAHERGERFFLPTDEPVIRSLALLAEWAKGGRFRPSAVSMFLEDPDYYLVGHAHAHGHIVVTHEVPSDGVREVKIPNACVAVKVRCMTPFEMLRAEGARFVLGRQP